MTGETVAALIPLGAFSMLAYIVHVLVEWRRQTQRVKLLTEFQTKLLDRMGNGQDFAAFFQSSGGERFLETISLDRSNPYDRVLRSLQAGVVALCLGIGFTSLAHMVDVEGVVGFTIIGVIILSLGLGFMLSAAAAYSISKSAGLLDQPWKPSGSQV
jgi:hypothetical protein